MSGRAGPPRTAPSNRTTAGRRSGTAPRRRRRRSRPAGAGRTTTVARYSGSTAVAVSSSKRRTSLSWSSGVDLAQHVAQDARVQQRRSRRRARATGWCTPRRRPPPPPRSRPARRRRRAGGSRSSMPAITSTPEIGSPSAQCAASGYRASTASTTRPDRAARAAPGPGCWSSRTTLQVPLSAGSVRTVTESYVLGQVASATRAGRRCGPEMPAVVDEAAVLPLLDRAPGAGRHQPGGAAPNAGRRSRPRGRPRIAPPSSISTPVTRGTGGRSVSTAARSRRRRAGW